MKNYIYNNKLVGKKQLRQLLAWCFDNYNWLESCSLADELKNLGFKYATKAGISISIEDLKVPLIKNTMLINANRKLLNIEKICLKGKITDVERFQKIIETWSNTSEILKNEVISYFKNYDPLNSVFIMAFSGARGNITQVRQLVGMRGVMADPSGAILKLPIKNNFREGLTITDYLISAYGARKGIIDTALKTANSGYLTRRLIDVAQDIIIREKDCHTEYSYIVQKQRLIDKKKNFIGRLLNEPIYDLTKQRLIADKNSQLTSDLLNIVEKNKIDHVYIRSPLTCKLYRSICQRCYGWDIAKECLIDLGDAVGILAGQSIGEPGTQLTMRTFHTGGVFTSVASNQIMSPASGLVKFSKSLTTKIIRTNTGESALFSLSSGSVIIVPENSKIKYTRLELPANTIIFIKENDYIYENCVIGELLANNKQIRIEISPIMTHNAGEIIVPNFPKSTKSSKHHLVWLLFGEVYRAPINSFLNFYSNYKINKYSYVFRSKLIAPFSGFINLTVEKKDFAQKILQVCNKFKFHKDCQIKKWFIDSTNYKYLLTFQKQNYLINLKKRKFPESFATVSNRNFKTVAGGTIYYKNWYQSSYSKKIFYYKPANLKVFKYIFQSIIFLIDIISEFNKSTSDSTDLLIENKEVYKIWKKIYFNYYMNFLKKRNFIKLDNSFIWLTEEMYNINYNKSILLVNEGDFISENFELLPNLLSKTQGVVTLEQHNQVVKKLIIRSGSLYKLKNSKEYIKQLYFPGELLESNIKILSPSICETVLIKDDHKLLIKSIEIYENPIRKVNSKKIQGKKEFASQFDLSSLCFYKSKQKIQHHFSIDLISTFLIINSLTKSKAIIFSPKLKNQHFELIIKESIYFYNYLPAALKYTRIKSCLLVETNQFLNSYITFGYFEAITEKSVKIVKIKSQTINKKDIILISNEDCSVVKKESFKYQLYGKFLISKSNLNCNGQILIDNGNFLTIQKGRPYFFPNCNRGNLSHNNRHNLKYKLFPQKVKKYSSFLKTKNSINLSYFDIMRKTVIKRFKKLYNFSRMFIEKNGRIYVTKIPILLKVALLKTKNSKLTSLSKDIFYTKNKSRTIKKRKQPDKIYLLFKDSSLSANKIRQHLNYKPNFLLFRMDADIFQNSITIYPITEDCFEEDLNDVFCNSNQFVENGYILGLLNFEKEITGDIVQGLPRIEQLFEARKIHLKSKKIPLSKKKHALIQQTSIDANLKFRKLGTTIAENQKINPHKLLKVYFKYYGSNRPLFSDITQTLIFARLANNFDACYHTFKKVQALILNQIQLIYESQGVLILDKHLEVIIKQMTTKVLVTHEGDTPLLLKEVLDLYHMNSINKVIKLNNKKKAYYVPIIFGITKAALNNPSFMSAASFQETTRILTKAAIEGRLDWLKGLKENIIIGGLIPAGTGTRTYKNCFKREINIRKIKSEKNFAKV